MNDVQSLVERARTNVRRKVVKGYTDEQIQVALAWLKGELGYGQLEFCLKELNLNEHSLYNFLATRLRQAYCSGFIRFPDEEKKDE